MTKIPEMVSPRKIFWHAGKVAAFLAGEPIYPATLELGLTTACNRSCPDCPSRKGRPGLFLDAATAGRLFSLCRGRTFGVILSGGEPTLHPGFGAILAAARENGFRDVVVISNGSRLGRAEVAEPLLRHASVVRVSLYDWLEGGPSGHSPTLRRIERLRAKIEKTGSSLKIGASLLTRGAGPESLGRAAAAVRAAGAHWLYLHPTCVSTPRARSGPRARTSCWPRWMPAAGSNRRGSPFTTSPTGFPILRSFFAGTTPPASSWSWAPTATITSLPRPSTSRDTASPPPPHTKTKIFSGKADG